MLQSCYVTAQLPAMFKQCYSACMPPLTLLSLSLMTFCTPCHDLSIKVNREGTTNVWLTIRQFWCRPTWRQRVYTVFDHARFSLLFHRMVQILHKSELRPLTHTKYCTVTATQNVLSLMTQFKDCYSSVVSSSLLMFQLLNMNCCMH